MPEQTRQSVDAPALTREASFAPATVDDKARTVDLVWSTGAKVRRYSWFRDEYYDEELSLDPQHVRLGRLNGGAPLLDSHGAYDLRDQFGVVQDGTAKVDGKEGTATVRFSARDDVEPFFRDVKDGIIRNVSIGYRVYKFERTPPLNDGDVATYRAVDWEPYEISLVCVPADADAGVRSVDPGKGSPPKNPCVLIETRAAPAAQTEEVQMDRESDTAGASADQNATTAATTTTAETRVDEAAVRADAVKAERVRAAEIRKAGKIAKVSDDFVQRHIDDGTDLPKFREAVFAEMAKRSAEGGEVRTHTARVGVEEYEKVRALAENAILNRANPTVKLDDGAREFRGYRLMELGRFLLERRGVRTGGMSPMQLAGAALGLDESTRSAVAGAQGTSDLANILANVMNKSLRTNYEGAPRTFTGWARRSTNPDFKTITRTILSNAPSLLALNESGEYKRGVVTDGKETYVLATYGRTVAFSRQAVINDDLNALSRIPSLMGRAAGDLESDTVYAVLTANAALADSVALFHATHANLAGSGAAIAVASLGAGRSAMRLQTGLEGRLINLVPRYLIVPSAVEQTAYQYTSANYVPTKAADTNEFRSGGRTALEVVVEPRLDAASATAWYLSADPAMIDTVEYCHLEGNEEPFTDTRVGWEVDGVEMKIRHDFAAKALDFRGLYKNPGA